MPPSPVLPPSPFLPGPTPVKRTFLTPKKAAFTPKAAAKSSGRTAQKHSPSWSPAPRKATPTKSGPESGRPKRASFVSPLFGFAALSPFRRKMGPRRSRAGAGAVLAPAAVALLAEYADQLEETRPAREALIEQFLAATASILTHSPTREHFLRLGRCCDPMLKHLSLDDAMLQEFRTWMPPRQAAAIRLLAYNPFLTSVVLNGCALDDAAGEVLAEVLTRSKSITSISVERNDLREAGLIALVETLRTNTTLKEMRINHQRYPRSGARTRG